MNLQQYFQSTPPPTKTKSSISDHDRYRGACKKAATDPEFFKNFKRDPDYQEILEHASTEQGQAYIEFILKQGHLDAVDIEALKSNDLQGNPSLIGYPEPFGQVSPSTLRYMKVLSELVDLFGDLGSKELVEIGVGYGGQCKLICDYFGPKSYTLFDLPEPLALSKVYLGQYDTVDLNFLDLSETTKEQYDLVISNYAFSEISRPIQLEYIEKVIKKAKHGYITFNFISNLFNIDSMGLEEFKTILGPKEYKVIQEIPLTFQNNIILVW